MGRVPIERPERVRHVWVLPALDVGQPRQGYVLAWRQVYPKVGPPQWQAQILVVDDRFDQVRVEWFYATELIPVRSDPPGYANPATS